MSSPLTYPPLTANEIRLVQNAWARVAIGHSYVHAVYDELFILAPELKTRFISPPHQLQSKLHDTLNTVLTSLAELDSLAFIIRDLGHRHRKWQVEPAHFTTLEEAMTRVLARRLGDEFTPELARAWSRAYWAISNIMLEGLATEE
ncbi:globin domain-containing protein [Aeromonas schubertii]|uniref:globin domain-containing protein n=1 Tax=Aeromonas schubertii TaxID=652 RepID=UPI001D05123B|nr:globin domain-containing protein [Aeromonas schubertii]